jgi:hypothetical protein
MSTGFSPVVFFRNSGSTSVQSTSAGKRRKGFLLLFWMLKPGFGNGKTASRMP